MNIIYHPPPFWGSSRQFSRVCNPPCFKLWKKGGPSVLYTAKNSGFCWFVPLSDWNGWFLWFVFLQFSDKPIFLALELHAFPRKNTGRKRVGFWRSRGKEREPTEVVGRLQDLHSSFGDGRGRLKDGWKMEVKWWSFFGVVVYVFTCCRCCVCWFNGCPT